MIVPHHKFTTSAKLSSIAKAPGNIIVVQDTGELYIDFDTSTRVCVGKSSSSVEIRTSDPTNPKVGDMWVTTT